MDGYEYLAIAIVTQAAQDYRREMKRYGTSPDIEKFFLSDWGNLLCFGKADLVFEKLKNEPKKPRKKPYLRHGMCQKRKKRRVNRVSVKKV